MLGMRKKDSNDRVSAELSKMNYLQRESSQYFPQRLDSSAFCHNNKYKSISFKLQQNYRSLSRERCPKRSIILSDFNYQEMRSRAKSTQLALLEALEKKKYETIPKSNFNDTIIKKYDDFRKSDSEQYQYIMPRVTLYQMKTNQDSHTYSLIRNPSDNYNTPIIQQNKSPSFQLVNIRYISKPSQSADIKQVKDSTFSTYPINEKPKPVVKLKQQKLHTSYYKLRQKATPDRRQTDAIRIQEEINDITPWEIEQISNL